MVERHFVDVFSQVAVKLQNTGRSKEQPLELSGQSLRSLTQGPVGHWICGAGQDNHSGQKSDLHEPSAHVN